MPAPGNTPQFSTRAQVGWEAALLEIEHQAEHWDTPDHGETGYLIAQALRAAVEIARTGGLQCEHRGGSGGLPEVQLKLLNNSVALAPSATAEEPLRPPSATA